MEQHQQQQQQQQQHQPVPVVGHAQQHPASFDPETSPVPGQQAWAILDLHGTMVRSSAAADSSSSSPIVKDANTLYGMLVESTPLISNGGGGLKRMTINFASSLRYVIARDDHHIYLVQTKGQ